MEPDGSWHLKDEELLDQRMTEGRWTKEEVRAIRDIGARILRDVLEPERWWWDRKWSQWKPDPDPAVPSFPAGWTEASVAPFRGLVV